MSILDRLLGAQPDPTKDWPIEPPPPAAFDLTHRAFGSLIFGGSLESAKSLGRPDRFEWTQPDYCELLYARSGFQIDFSHGSFGYLAFFLGPDALLPRHPDMTFSQPELGEGIRLTDDTSRAQLDACFGLPDAEDTDENETILFYTRNGIAVEFEYARNGLLKRCNLYPK